MEKLIIRREELSDARGIAALFSQQSVCHGTLRAPFLSLLETENRIKQAGAQNNYVLVAELDGKIIGQAGLHMERSYRRRHCAGIGLAVSECFWGKGVGSRLVGELVALADNWLGLHRLELGVFTDNKAAIKLYEKYGFVIEGTEKDSALQAGKFVDVYKMARIKTLEVAKEQP